MKEKYRAIRIEIPIELYERLKKCVEKDYSNITSISRELIVKYVKDKEMEEINLRG